MTTTYFGDQGFRWFFGTVEDRDDPLKLGRVRVRVYGIHPPDANLVATDNLPWAQVIQPVTSAASNKVGSSPTGIAVGSTVMGFFADGNECQLPIVMGTLAGIPDNDTNKHDVSPLAREINSLNKEITSGEPESAYQAKYPYNKVTESESGHVVEIDDTPNAERLHVYHKSGSYVEINSEGRRVDKIVGDGYEIVLLNKTMYIKGNLNINVDNTTNITTNDYNLTVNGTAKLKFNGDYKVHYGADKYERHEQGTDYSCPSDPPRASDTSCEDI
jgi:hypothetical protein